MDTDLFGAPIVDLPQQARKYTSRSAWRGGYAAQPGSGPKGETCGTCHFRARVKLSKTYQKCLVVKHAWTGGPGSDIKCKMPACRHWQPQMDAKVEL